MIQAVINAAKAVQEAEFHKQLSYQLNIENTRISELESHAEEIRHIRHDRRQHVQVLRGLLEHEDIQKALEYLADYEQSMAEAIKPSLCENFVADTLCRRYAALAEHCRQRYRYHTGEFVGKCNHCCLGLYGCKTFYLLVDTNTEGQGTHTHAKWLRRRNSF